MSNVLVEPDFASRLRQALCSVYDQIEGVAYARFSVLSLLPEQDRLL
jgi:hypothetical protein